MAAPDTQPVIYEVECRLDPAVVADFDAWLPGHLRQVLECRGFTGAGIQMPAFDESAAPVRRIQYRLESATALERYLAEDAPRMEADGAARFGEQVAYARRVFVPAAADPSLPETLVTCQNCGATVLGKYCGECGQSGHVHVLSVGDVAHDIVHSVLHLDSSVWRTLRSLVLKPGELTNEFIAGRRQRYLPPFRLYLVLSVAFFALSAVLPDAEPFVVTSTGETVLAPVTVRLPGGHDTDSVRQDAQEAHELAQRISDKLAAAETGDHCSFGFGWPRLDGMLKEACKKVQQDRGRRLGEVFLANAPKLMFLFLPLMAALAMLFYWKPRRLYAEHLVLFLHSHAFLFLWLAITALVGAAASLDLPLVGMLGFVNFLLFAYVPYYVFRAMRVVYGNGRALTTVKFLALSAVYFALLGITMVVGVMYSMLSL